MDTTESGQLYAAALELAGKANAATDAGDALAWAQAARAVAEAAAMLWPNQHPNT